MTRHSRSIFDERTVRADQSRLRITQHRLSVARAHTSAHTSSPSNGPHSSGARSREIVVRVLNKGKTPRTAINQARYIARVNNADHGRDPERQAPTTLETHDGRTLRNRAEIDTEIQSWGLKDGDENRSSAWLNTSPEDRRRLDQQWRDASPEWRKENPKADPFRSVQTAHIIVSVPNGTADQIAEAVRAAAADKFGGHRYVYAVHTDHGRGPHAHIVVHAPNMDTGYALPLKKADLAAMRHRFAEAAQTAGLDVVATRRVDRLASEIAQGIEPYAKHDRSRGRWTPGDTFRTKAPRWHGSHYGTEYGARSASLRDVDQPKPFAERYLGRSPSELKSDGFRETLKSFSHYQNPHESTKSYLALYAENPRLAQWAFMRHPIAFGQPTAPGPATAPDGRVAARAARDVASSLYPAPKADRAAQLQTTVPAARAAQRRERGAGAVARSQDSLSRDAARAGDITAAEDARSRAQAARQGARLPGFRRSASIRPSPTQPDKQNQTEMSENKKVQKFADLDVRVRELQRANKQQPSPDTANDLVKAQMLRRKAAEAIIKDSDALKAAQDAGLSTRIQLFIQQTGRERGGLTL